MSNCFKVFFVSIITHLLELVSKFDPQHSQPSSSGDVVDQEDPAQAAVDDAVDRVEAPVQAARDDATEPAETPAQAAGLVVIHHKEWTEIMIAFCLPLI